MTTTTTHPVQIMLPGQAAAPDGPVDMIMMYVMHHAFRRDLDAFAAAVPATPAEDRGAWRALLSRWTVFATVLHHHHTGEDTGLWPALIARCDGAGDDGALETLQAMEAEHGELGPLLEASEAGLRRMANGGDGVSRADLTSAVSRTRESLSHHLAHEETDAIVLMQRYLEDADWQAIEQEYFVKPMRLSDATSAVAWALHGLPVDVRRRVLAAAPTPFVVIDALTRHRFLRQDRAAFRYAA